LAAVILFLDIQTNHDAILEIAWTNEHASCTRSFLVQQDLPLSAISQQLTGITPDTLKHAHPLDLVLEVLQKHLNESTLLVVHYLSFEKRILDKLGVHLPENKCLHQWAKELLPELKTHSLRSLCGYYGLDLPMFKRSMHHAALSREIWLRLQDPDRTFQRSQLVEKKPYNSLPQSPGVYFFKDHKGRIMYVGKAKNIRRRVQTYFGKQTKGKHAEMLACSHSIDHEICSSELEAFLTEYSYIRRLRPYYNDVYNRNEPKAFYLNRSLDKIYGRQSAHACYGPYYNSQFKDGLEILQQNINCLKNPDSEFECPFKDVNDLDTYCRAFLDFTQRFSISSVRDAMVIGYHLRTFAKVEQEESWTYAKLEYALQRWLRFLAEEFFQLQRLSRLRHGAIHLQQEDGYLILKMTHGNYKGSKCDTILQHADPLKQKLRWSYESFCFTKLLNAKISSKEYFVLDESGTQVKISKSCSNLKNQVRSQPLCTQPKEE
jgi:DNA polymerase III epsilon subunit-like protein